MTAPSLAIVGVGPGEPELVTLKAARLIREADVVIAPVGDRSDSSVAGGIIAEFVDSQRQQVISHVYPMAKDPARLHDFWRESARQVKELVRAGRRVVFVTLGDPLLYSTAIYLARALRQSASDINIEFIPGVSSINAATARIGQPLALADERLAILPATFEGDKLRRTLEDFDTVVLMKVHRVFQRVKVLLEEMNLLENAVYIRRLGMEGEKVCADLTQVRPQDLNYLSMVIVRSRGSQE